MEINRIVELLKDSFGDAIIELAETKPDPYLKVNKDRITDICSYLSQEPQLGFDTLMILSGMDLGDKLAVVYHLYSLQHKHRIVLKAELPKDNPAVHTVESIWQAANWFEREAAEMYGITFIDHPDPRKLLLTEDWIGCPMRKDYVYPESWHGMPLKRPADEK
ncbi:MAG: NADH-quinone oxidoreductase subunit C [Planctomycetes bacterium]|nr:NADH-quinone oxidoreductase subunit C [Planctomycetota bacterium]